MDLQPHQKRVVESDRSRIAYHSLGSGKTLTGLAAIARAQKESDHDAAFIVPAPLVNNVKKEIEKHDVDIDMDRLDILSYQKAGNRLQQLTMNPKSIVVFDEVHRARNKGTKVNETVRRLSEASDKTLSLTGSPIYNSPDDLSSIINTVANDKVMEDITDRYIGTRKTERTLMQKIRGITAGEEQYVTRSSELKGILNHWIDRYEVSQDSADFPTKIEKTIKVPMSKHQEIAYEAVEGKIPEGIQIKLAEGLPMTVGEANKLMTFSTGLRMASLSTGGILSGAPAVSSKIDAAVANLKKAHENDENHKAVVYSAFLEAGLDPYLDRLHKEGLADKAQVFKGGMTDKRRKEVMDAYNSGEKPILLVSSAGAEGLDLKGTKQMQILDPHFNNEKIKQVIGRGNRYQSHSHLPEEERKVEVEHYHSVFPKSRIPFSKQKIGIDETLHGMAARKDALSAKIQELIN